MGKVAANQQNLLRQVVVEGAAEEQVVEEGDPMEQVVGEGAAVVQVDLGGRFGGCCGCALGGPVGVLLSLLSLSFALLSGFLGGSAAGPSILLKNCKIYLPCYDVHIPQIVV